MVIFHSYVRLPEGTHTHVHEVGFVTTVCAILRASAVEAPLIISGQGLPTRWIQPQLCGQVLNCADTCCLVHSEWISP